MVDEQDEKNLAELDEGRQGGVSAARINELEALLAGRDEALAKAGIRLSELEQSLASRESDISRLEQARTEMEERLQGLSHSLAEAVDSYKAMMIQANPEVMAELVSGDSIPVINEAVSKAKALVSKVRQGLEAEVARVRVPAGAPERTSLDLSALSSREKIQYAIKRSP